LANLHEILPIYKYIQQKNGKKGIFLIVACVVVLPPAWHSYAIRVALEPRALPLGWDIPEPRALPLGWVI
jgi:hypothetical protein